MNVGSRVVQAGFTDTRGVLVRAVLSAGVGGPASCLGVRGSLVVVAPSGQVDGRVEVTIEVMVVGAGERPLGQSQIGAAITADRAELAGGIPAVGLQYHTAAPELFVVQLTGKLGPAGS